MTKEEKLERLQGKVDEAKTYLIGALVSAFIFGAVRAAYRLDKFENEL